MSSDKKHIRSYFWALAGSICLLAVQSIWVCKTFQLEQKHLIKELKEAFALAYEKEQTYRVPVVDIVNPGEVTMQSCGDEEIIIVRKCPDTDTIVYNNLSGRSVEKFLNHVFRDLRENIAPMNIFCLSDLFGGMLHDKNIPAYFIIERYNTVNNTVLETTLIPEEQQQPPTRYVQYIILEISDTESLRAILELTPGIILSKMTYAFISTILLTLIVLFCIYVLLKTIVKDKKINHSHQQTEQIKDSPFHIGKYKFNPFKNELQGFGETIQLNKKENSILHTLCIQQGNVIERNILLKENWGSNGLIYSRSLDTYVATLRKYLRKDPDIQIVTIKGVGYKLVCNE